MTLSGLVTSPAKEITATEFKARCLRLLDEVAGTGEALVVTKRGRPVVRVEPANPPLDLNGSVKLLVGADELIEPLDVDTDIAAFDPARVVWQQPGGG